MIISQTGITPAPARVEPIRDFPTSQNKKQLHVFFGLAKDRSFCEKFSSTAGPLFALLREKAQWC